MTSNTSSVQHQFKTHLVKSSGFAFLIFLLVYVLLMIWFIPYQARQDVIQHQTQDLAVSFQRFILDNNVSIFDKQSIEQWNGRHSYVILLIHEEPNVSDTTSKTFSIDFKEGRYPVHILLLNKFKYKSRIAVVSSTIAILSYLGFQMYFFKKRHANYQSLMSQLEDLTTDDASKIEPSHSQIDSLILDSTLDKLRNKIENFKRREKSREQVANDLMASFSHDLRTPLTVIIGYLEILGEKPSNRIMVGKAIERTKYLHQMMDDALHFFYSSSLSKTNLQVETVNFVTMLRHYCTYLEAILSERHSFTNRLTNDPTNISINEGLMNRLFDNVLSNLMKYSDQNKPISLMNYVENGWLVFEQVNSVSPSNEHSSGSGLGLKTCRRIMLLHNGRLETSIEGKTFTLRLYFPYSL